MSPHTVHGTSPKPPRALVATVLAALFAGCFFTGCEKSDAKPAKLSKVPQYEVRGLLHEKKSGGTVIVVEHEDVPGLMPSMTMPFHLKNAAESAPFTAGDALAFTLFMEQDDTWVANLHAIDPKGLKLPVKESRENAVSPGKRLKVGDAWPDFNLLDQNGEPLTAASFAGRHVLVNFIFVRCAVQNFCPLMSRNFSEIQTGILADKNLAEKMRLLSVSFDPEDRPAILKEYAATFSKDPHSWIFATGTPTEVQKLTSAFSVRVEEEGGTINHGLCTALISPEGKVLQLWRGNAWTPAEVLQNLSSAR